MHHQSTDGGGCASAQRERLYWNNVRGIAIMLMLWGHAIQYCGLGQLPVFENRVFLSIYSFHMPLFMLVSGFLFHRSCEKRSLPELLMHRVAGLLWPILGGTVLNNLLMLLPQAILSHGENLSVWNGALLNGWSELIWFLWSLLAASVVTGISCKIGKTPWKRGLFLILCLPLLALFPNVNYNLLMYPFFLTGYELAKHKAFWQPRLKRWRILIYLLFPLLLMGYGTEHLSFVTTVFPLAPRGFWPAVLFEGFRFLTGLFGSLFVLVSCDLLLPKISGSFKPVRLLNKLGQSSLQIYILSIPLFSGFLPHLMQKAAELLSDAFWTESILFYNWVFTPLVSIAYAFGLLLVFRLMQRAKIDRLFFGR